MRPIRLGGIIGGAPGTLRPLRGVVVLPFIFGCCVGVARIARASLGTCQPESVAVDTSRGDTYAGGIVGHAPGETFLARDTVISSVSVWRLADEWNSIWDLKLWIVGVDSTGMPDPGVVVLEGPSINAVGDSVRPTEIRWILDPPVALPGLGMYAFFVQSLCDGFFNILADDRNSYPDGIVWETRRSDALNCHLRGLPGGYPGYDLVFTIVFCHDTVTPVKRSSWGRLKTIYR